MIISPPFLPTLTAQQLGATGPAAIDPMMNAVDGFELPHHGVFPIAFDRRWHCGVHLVPMSQDEPVRAIADGEVVAYRVCQKSISDGKKENGTEVLNSNAGFVLLKHSTETGDGRIITFYSLYQHLLDLDATRRRRPQQGEAPTTGTSTALPKWLTMPTNGVQVPESQKVYRKDILGYPGNCHGTLHLHFEIFMTEGDFNAWFNQPGHAVQLDNKAPTTPASKDYWGHSYFVVPAGQAFVSAPPEAIGATAKYFPALQTGQLAADTKLYVEAFYHKGQRYTRSWLDKAGEITALTPEPVQSGANDYEYDMYARATALYSKCPSDGYEMLRFGRILDEHSTQAAAPPKTWIPVMFEAGKQGYLDISQRNIQKLSDADFPFFMDWQKIEEDNTPFNADGICDYDSLANIVKVVEGLSTPAESRRSEWEQEDKLAAYIQTYPAVREKLKGFICHAPSEWDARNNDARYRRLNQPDGFFGKRKDTQPDGYENFLKFHTQLQFLDQTPLSSQSKFWFFHPLAFIRHFRKCGWLSKNELHKIYDENNYTSVGKTGEEYKEHYRNAINLVSRKYSLNSLVRFPHFFGQCAIESFYMMVVRESSMAISKAVKTNHASVVPENSGYLRSPPAAPADVAYFVKYDAMSQLGNTDPGDGGKFRGRGFKQLTGRYNYSEYWIFRGWLDGASYDHAWFKKHKPGPVIDNPELAGNDPFACVDTAGFYCAYRRVAKAADGGVNEPASRAVSKIVNPFDHKSPPLRWDETKKADNVLGDKI